MKLDIPAHPFRGYIFDCDGTIADTMPIHFKAWTQAMKDFGGTFPEDLFYQWGGTPTATIVEQLNEKFGLSLDVQETVDRKERYYLENVTGVLPVVPVLEIAQRMHGLLPLAIASGGHREMVEATLRAINIIGMFDAIVCAEDCERGKPFPDPFLEAARRINVPAEDCLVFEDSPTGVEAAKAAGMRYVFVPSAGIPR
ncbi:MAG TPA: HAD family phosphatase [Terrimicrobiaceae bacterium]|nr:HAD family phosphatase [Terrimicrobiaceae bacterium]